jgi:hypothetical protein
MRQLSYVLQFRGSVAPVAGSSQTLPVTATAPVLSPFRVPQAKSLFLIHLYLLRSGPASG